MNFLIDLIEKRNYQKAKHEISKLKETNPPLFESLEAYINVLDTKNQSHENILDKNNDGQIENKVFEEMNKIYVKTNGISIEKIFSNVLRKYPSHPDPWRFISLAYSDKGYLEKSKESLKICFNLGNRNRFVISKLFSYSLYFKDLETINDMKNYFTEEKISFINRYFKKTKENTKFGNERNKIIISEKNILFERFKKLKILKIEDTINYDNRDLHKNQFNSVENKNLNSNHIKNNINISSIRDLKKIYKMEINDILEYFVDYEFKHFFYKIAKELYEQELIETAIYCLNAFFIIQNNQMDYLNFYFILFEENRFTELEIY
ncbi:hypothetical protein DMUE_4822 [Dictyocoela muelleri]|nr:hypothetical protein DMUE_4822 [Dictyocoela muelleri]